MGELIEATIKEVKNSCRRMFDMKESRGIAVNIMGPPGIGKTDLFAQLAEEWGADYRVFLTATMDPTDVVGVPHEKNGITHFCPPGEWIALTEDCGKLGKDNQGRYLVDPQRPIVAVLEDLPACSPQVFNALLRVMCNREVAGSKIRDNVFLGATGNRVEDRAGAAQITTALANRFLHFSIRADQEEWCDWALQNQIDPYVISFVEKKGVSALHNFDASSGFVAFATPRSVAMASKMLKATGSNDEKALNLALSGCCGSGWASEFLAFFRIREKIIPVEEIFADPDHARIPKPNDIDLVFSTINNLIGALLNKFSVPRTEAFLKYIYRMDSEESILYGAKKFLRNVVSSNKLTHDDQNAITNNTVWTKIAELHHLTRDAT